MLDGKVCNLCYTNMTKHKTSKNLIGKINKVIAKDITALTLWFGSHPPADADYDDTQDHSDNKDGKRDATDQN